MSVRALCAYGVDVAVPMLEAARRCDLGGILRKKECGTVADHVKADAGVFEGECGSVAMLRG
jgi:hypothetical protein